MRAGYKHTDVGMIPNEWEVAKLGERATFRTGPFGSALHKSDYTSDGVPVINPMHIINGRLQPTRTMTVTDHAASMLVDFRLRRGDVIIGRRGDMGRCALVDESYAGWLCGTGSLIVRPAATVDPGFLQRLLSSPSVVAAIEDGSVGSTMVNLNQIALDGLRLQLPPLHEQHAISATLRDVDALLAALEKLIAKKRDLKLAAMQQLLTGKTRLAGLPGAWDAPTLGDLFTFKNGLNKAKRFFGFGTPIVNYMDVYANRGITSGDVKGRVSVDRDELKAFGVRRGDVFFTRTSETADEVGISSVMLDEPRDTVFSGFVLRARPRYDTLDDQFKKYCFSTASVRRQITSQSTETTRALTNGRLLAAVSVARPPRPEQEAIAAVLSDMDAEIAALEARLAKTHALKRGMMQELLTGSVRLV